MEYPPHFAETLRRKLSEAIVSIQIAQDYVDKGEYFMADSYLDDAAEELSVFHHAIHNGELPTE